MLRPSSPISSAPSPRPVDRRRAVITRITAAPPPAPISAVTAPQATARRPHHRLRQANHPNISLPAVDVPSAPPSSASVPDTNQARRRCTSNGGAPMTHRRVRLIKAELGVSSRGAAVVPIADEVARGGDGRIQITRAAGARSDPLSLRSNPLRPG